MLPLTFAEVVQVREAAMQWFRDDEMSGEEWYEANEATAQAVVNDLAAFFASLKKYSEAELRELLLRKGTQ